jgi:hypothetical protein
MPVGNQPVSWINLCQWIKANQPNFHFHAFLCVGDFAAEGSTSWDLPAKQQLAWQEGLSVAAKSGKPFLSSPGNHDNEPNTPGWFTYSYDQNIGYEQIKGYPWFAASWVADPVNNTQNTSVPSVYSNRANQAIAFSNGAQQVLAIALELCPRPNALVWAQNLIASYPTHDVVLLTHWYLDLSGEPFSQSEVFANGEWDPTQPNVIASSGQTLHQWIKNQPRLILSLCGHVVTEVGGDGYPVQPNIVARTDATARGDTTVGIIANYQFTGCGRPDWQNPRPCCEVALMLDIGETSIGVRAFNTTLQTELDSAWGYPMSLSLKVP